MKVFKLMFKNALRHKLRTLLTILGIAIAVMAFGVLQTVVTAWYAGIEASAANRLIARHSVSFIFPLPYAYRDQIARIEGVENVTFANWFQGVYIDKNQFFARLAVDAETIFDVYPEFIVEPDQLAAFKRERNSCVLGQDIAQQYKLKIGDVMQLDGDIYPGKWEFVVRAIYRPRDKTIDGTQMLFHWQNLDERMKQEMPGRAGDVGWYVIRIKNPDQAATISQRIDDLFRNSPAETKTETERQFQQGFLQSASTILTSMNVLSFVIIGIIMLVLGNTMIMAARERTLEYAVLKTLGFSGGHLVGLIAGESLVISAIGAATGVAITYPLVSLIAAFIPKGIFPVFYVEPLTVLLAAIAAILVGIVASVFPIQRAVRTSIVEGLRFIG